jgi:hypothetical protein
VKRLGVGIAVLLVGFSSPIPAENTPSEGWIPFAGTWSASGRRQTVAVEDGGAAAVVEMSGAVVLTSREGLAPGFRGEAIGFDDGQGLSVGRSVWTDERGDHVFSRLRGESLGTGKRVVGTITGGTGRYAGLVGEYSFTWQYVLSSSDEAGAVQGRATSLEGRVRRANLPR